MKLVSPRLRRCFRLTNNTTSVRREAAFAAPESMRTFSAIHTSAMPEKETLAVWKALPLNTGAASTTLLRSPNILRMNRSARLTMNLLRPRKSCVSSFRPGTPGTTCTSGSPSPGMQAVKRSARSSTTCCFLQRQIDVVALIIYSSSGHQGQGEAPGANIGQYLACYDVSARTEVQTRPRTVCSKIILDRSVALGASFLVIGAYSQPHLRKTFAGSATKQLLTKLTITVLCSH